MAGPYSFRTDWDEDDLGLVTFGNEAGQALNEIGDELSGRLSEDELDTKYGGGGAGIQVGGDAPDDGWYIDVEVSIIEVTPAGPTWTDDNESGGGSWTTPTETGVTYSPASGTAEPGEEVTVTATAASGYVLTGATSWSHTFPSEGAIEVTPTGPTWTDDDEAGGGTWSTPSETGVTYSPASGSADPGEEITVDATATSGYVLTGTTSWSHTFPEAPAPAGPPADDFNRTAVPTGGTLGTSSSGHVWQDPKSRFYIGTLGSWPNGNLARALSGTGYAVAWLTADDVVTGVEAEIAYDTDKGGLAVCHDGDDSYYLARTSGSNVQVYRVTDGALTLVDQASSGGATVPFTMRLDVADDGSQTTLTVKINGSTVLTAIDSTAGRPALSARAGMIGQATSGGARMDDFEIFTA